MDGRCNNSPFVNSDQQQDSENLLENSSDSPSSGVLNDGKMTNTHSPKRSRRAVQKRVVSVPIRDVEGSRLKGDSAPPSDSWAWRKYGQKPIKGSPYPRGYYRCSSSKGCPARKQVERSRVDPTMVVVTYSCDHNHPWPPSKNHHHNNNNNNNQQTATATAAEVTSISATVSNSEDDAKTTVFENKLELAPKERFTNLGEESLIEEYDQFKWFSDLESTSSTLFESPIFSSGGGDADGAVILSMGEEDEESLFADLGELPEFAVVFRRGVMEKEEEERRRFNLAPWCGTTG